MRASLLEMAVLQVLARAEKPLSAREVADRLKERGFLVTLIDTEATLDALMARLLVEWAPQRRYPVVAITRAGLTVAGQGED